MLQFVFPCMYTHIAIRMDKCVSRLTKILKKVKTCQICKTKKKKLNEIIIQKNEFMKLDMLYF